MAPERDRTAVPETSPAPRAEQEPLLQIKDLFVGYLDHEQNHLVQLIRHVDLTIRRHEIVGLVGESGSGKTQMARAILQLNTPPLRPLSGQILLRGQDLLTLEGKRLRDIRGSKVAMIFQDPRASLNPLMRVGDQLARMYMLHQGTGRQQAHAESLEMLRRVGIAGPERVARSYPHQLSGGMCQRVMIGLCLGMNPELLIADEPTTGLDVTIQAQILDLIRAVQAETGTAVLLITHDLGVVAETCQRVAVMYAGRIVEIGPVSEIFARSLHPYTRRLLQASLDLESPEQVSQSSVPATVDITVGPTVFQASVESVGDPASPAIMVEVGPGHLVLVLPPSTANSTAVPGSAEAVS